MQIDIRQDSTGEQEQYRNRVRLGVIEIGGVRYPHLETTDFPQDDPWSRHMAGVIDSQREAGVFVDSEVTELGIGDGRNVIRAGRGLQRITAIDIEDWRLEAGLRNLAAHPNTADVPVRGFVGDAVAVLNNWDQLTNGEPIRGHVIACLPQSPEGVNLADKYDDNPLLQPYASWGEVGLTLNAAVLAKLQERTADTVRIFLMLSHRVSKEAREDMISSTGWTTVREHRTGVPIQQDPDTGVAYTIAHDDGNLFFELKNGVYQAIPAEEAEVRRKQSADDGTGRASLNVYHHLSVHEIRKKTKEKTVFSVYG